MRVIAIENTFSKSNRTYYEFLKVGDDCEIDTNKPVSEQVSTAYHHLLEPISMIVPDMIIRRRL